MKIAIMSDLHLDANPISIKDLGLDVSVDYCIVAGDVHPDELERDEFLNAIEEIIDGQVFFVPGNHDFYGPTPASHAMLDMPLVNGVMMIGATLWTRLDPLQWVQYSWGLNDAKLIRNWRDNDSYNALHEKHKEFLLSGEGEIVVSHHAPSWKSITPQFLGDPLNVAFVNNLDEEILNLPKPPKLWVHGHVHSEHDYYIGSTRILCHPRGYRFEPSSFNEYKAKIIEI